MENDRMARPRVFFPCRSRRFNIKSADKFGTAEFIFNEGEISAFNTDRYLTELGEALEKFKFEPTRDFIAVTGPVVQVALTVGYIMSHFEQVWVLIYDAKVNRYRERLVEGTPQTDRA
jgi:hypothetical protein